MATGPVGEPTGATPSRARRSLVPREHGAYAQLLAPLLLVLLAGRPSLSATLLALAALLAFVGHESMLVLLGQRGRRAKETDGPRAQALGLRLGLAAAILGGLGLALPPALSLWSTATPAVLVIITAALIAARRERTAAGESVVAVALTSAALPVGIAAGLAEGVVLRIGAAWTIGFVVATLAVRVVLAARRRSKGQVPPALRLLAAAPVVMAALVWPSPILRACAPLLALSAAMLAWLPPARHVRAIGWGLAAATTATVVWMGLALRA